MIILNENTQLVVTLDLNKSTDDLDFSVIYEDVSKLSTIQSQIHGVTNGTTEVEMVGSSISGKTRIIRWFNIYNKDNNDIHHVNVFLKSGTTYTRICKASLEWTETLQYSNGKIAVERNERKYNKDYIFLRLTSNQTTNLTAGNLIHFDSAVGTISYNSSTYQVTLKKNTAYLVETNIVGLFSAASSILRYGPYNFTDSNYPAKLAIVDSMTYALSRTNSYPGTAIFQPLDHDFNVGLRINESTNLTTAYNTNTYMIVHAI